MTILENLAIADNKGKAYGLGRGTNHARMDAYRELLASVGLGLEDKMHTKVGALSGGQRQTLALLMATMKPIEFLILDEHTAALDPKTAEIVMQLTGKIVCAGCIAADGAWNDFEKGTIVDSTIISAPSSTKNKEKQRDPDAHQVKKGNTWHFGYKAHIGVDKDSGIVHTVKVTAANQHDVSMTSELLTGEETVVYGDSGYLGTEKREDAVKKNANGKRIRYKINRRPSQIAKKSTRSQGQLKRREHEKSSVRAKVEHVFAVVKSQLRYRKTRYRGLRKQTAKLNMMFALANLILADRPCLAV